MTITRRRRTRSSRGAGWATIALYDPTRRRRLPRRPAHRLVSRPVLVRRWPHDLRRHRALGREGSRRGEAEGRRPSASNLASSPPQGRGEGARRTGGRRSLARPRRRRHAAPEDQRPKRSSAQHAGGVARRRRPVRPARQRISGTRAPIRRQQLAYAVNWTRYAMDRTIGRPAADLSLVDIETGARTKVKDGIEDQYLQASPGGRYLLYMQADQYLDDRHSDARHRQHLEGAATSFVNRESDATIKQKPTFGVAGWTNNDDAVLLYDKFDVWRVGGERRRRNAPHGRRDRTDPPSLRPARSGRRMDRRGAAAATSACSESGRSGPATRGSIRCDAAASAGARGQERQRRWARPKNADVYAYVVRRSTTRRR